MGRRSRAAADEASVLGQAGRKDHAELLAFAVSTPEAAFAAGAVSFGVSKASIMVIAQASQAFVSKKMGPAAGEIDGAFASSTAATDQ